MTYLITGGTGSLGSRLVKALAPTASRVIVFSRDEVKQGALADAVGHPQHVNFFLGDVRDYPRLVDAMHGIHTVVHTAALKRVDQVSYNPSEVLQTNILGTWNVLRAAMAAYVQRVLVISSDKAVHPANVYGASKLMGEFLTIRHNAYSYPRGTRCSVLRYGNVWGSRGSLPEVFQAQMAAGQALTVTLSSMTRFFVTLPQAVGYVQTALDRMDGGEVFVPMLKSWTVGQVARLFMPNEEQWQWIAVRPGGEKQHEQLIATEEEDRVSSWRPFYCIHPEHSEWREPTRFTPVKLARPYTSQNAERVLDEALVTALAEMT